MNWAGSGWKLVGVDGWLVSLLYIALIWSDLVWKMQHGTN
jgi:hypothetical protein